MEMENVVYVGNGRLLFYPSNLTFGTYHLYLNANDIRTTPPILKYEFEPEWARFFHSKIKEDDTVIDVGAFNGFYSIMAVHAGAKLVFAYEPNPYSFQLLITNIESNNLVKRIKAYEKAITNTKEKEVAISVGRDFEHAASHVLLTEVEKRMSNHFPVDCIRLDEEISNADVVKIDVEGMEYDVWRSMQGIVGKGERLKMFIEMHKYITGDMDDKLIKEIHDAGFKIERHEDNFQSDLGERYFLYAERK
jgi:FkbM family methyltransferase